MCHSSQSFHLTLFRCLHPFPSYLHLPSSPVSEQGHNNMRRCRHERCALALAYAQRQIMCFPLGCFHSVQSPIKYAEESWVSPKGKVRKDVPMILANVFTVHKERQWQKKRLQHCFLWPTDTHDGREGSSRLNGKHRSFISLLKTNFLGQDIIFEIKTEF